METKKLWWVGVFAVAMAYLESAVVVYLRRVFGITDLIRDVPLLDDTIGAIEVGREAATLVMLLAIGWAAGRSFQARAGFFLFTFGIWDIFYYLWLKVFIDWPASLLTPDILFLIPLPWWGPVISPVLIAALMSLGGGLAVYGDQVGYQIRLSWQEWLGLVAGNLMMLYAFMEDAIAILPADAETLSQLTPSAFNWPVYLVGFGLALMVVFRTTWPSFQKKVS
jgi:hypothetical protein